jgi:hypothetical protein
MDHGKLAPQVRAPYEGHHFEACFRDPHMGHWAVNMLNEHWTYWTNPYPNYKTVKKLILYQILESQLT